jgi:ribonuclease HII
MALWAGIDEAGYGPALGPLVVAGAAFTIRREPREGLLWEVLRDAVARQARGSDGRLVVNDSKQVYSPALGLRRLEEGVLAFVRAQGGAQARSGGALFAGLAGGRAAEQEVPESFRGAADFQLPLATNLSALESKASALREVLKRCGVRLVSVRAAVVFPPEFNRIVARTRNKSLLLFQKCGLILQDVWSHVQPGASHVLVDKHGGRSRYRRLLLDVFPDCQCDILEEGAERSVYRVAEASGARRTLLITFREGADARALPVALASMVAKYVRELYMLAFNVYWQQRLQGLKATTGYHHDARRFVRDITPALRAEGVDLSSVVRRR